MNASCLLLTILIANQSAARADLSLPYLAQVTPEALRFAARRTLGPPPLRPNSLADAKPPEPRAPVASDRSDTPLATSSAEPAQTGDSTNNPSSDPTPTPPVTSPPVGAPLVPDIYAPANRPVTIEELLPFFIPPPTPASRATYEVK